jgi:hypothetical protein
LLDAWRGQAGDLVDYAGGRQSPATADLERRRAAIAASLATSDLSAARVDELLRRRLEAQLGVGDALISHDPVLATQRLREAAAASDQLGRPLAQALSAQVPIQAPPPTEGLDIDVRLSLNLLLHEHVWLTSAAASAAADGRAADSNALVASANQNAIELGQQIGTVWGTDLGDGLAERWRGEVGALVNAASGGDRRQAAADLDRLRGELDGLLSGANPLLPRGLLTQQLRASDQPLLTAADALQARDFSSAYERIRDAARQMQKPADSLALSIVDRFPGRYLALPTAVPDQ